MPGAYVYLILDTVGEVVYIGVTRQLRDRLKRHTITSRNLGRDYDRFVAWPYAHRLKDARRDEARLIARHRPRYNVAGVVAA